MRGVRPRLANSSANIFRTIGICVGIVDLIAAKAPADPGLGHALGVADGTDLVLEGEVARGRGAGVEMLVGLELSPPSSVLSPATHGIPSAPSRQAGGCADQACRQRCSWCRPSASDSRR